jgi:hypothetical protein
MKRNGIEGARTCVEVVEPYFGPFAENAMARLERSIKNNSSVEELGDALAGYYRIFDFAGAQVAFDEAPLDVQNIVDVLRDGAIAKIELAGDNPDEFNVMPDYLSQ